MRSANGSPPLFAHFAGTMQSLDSPPPCMEDLWLIAFSSRPAYCRGRRRGLPVLAHGVSLHAWGLRLRGTAPRSRYRDCALLPSVLSDAVGFPEHTISELNTQPTNTPVQRFKCDVAAALTWLGARVVRYSFPVRLFHSLLHAGLSRRYPDTSVCATNLIPKVTYVSLWGGPLDPLSLHRTKAGDGYFLTDPEGA
jgi:hypothetical protein